MLDRNDPQWQKLIDEILSGMAEWRNQHPKATFGEIERETIGRVAKLQARIMEEIALVSQVADWDESSAPFCSACGARLRRRGKQERSLQVSGGEEVILKRAYAVCPACGTGIFPPG